MPSLAGNSFLDSFDLGSVIFSDLCSAKQFLKEKEKSLVQIEKEEIRKQKIEKCCSMAVIFHLTSQNMQTFVHELLTKMRL